MIITKALIRNSMRFHDGIDAMVRSRSTTSMAIGITEKDDSFSFSNNNLNILFNPFYICHFSIITVRRSIDAAWYEIGAAGTYYNV